ncbi:MAG: 4-hydroxy-2-oxovalerate aldolase [Elusimicrobia bacterium]|nr:4-hydroxy-2-oxovalerate aldolase [Elusimicrobiota bacterium]
MRAKILETTLRDGSYAINFQFTAADTALIGAALEKAGFELIELGHGVGLRASACGHGVAVETDEAYLKAAADSIKKAKWGMFCIPGIARIEDVDMAARHGMDFIRIGTNVTEVAASEKFIERAKKHGMFVSANFMKSYAMAPKEFGQMAKLTQRYGSDVLCVVDSAGGMLASELKAYFKAVREACDIPLAFHGHDNLGLAVSHSLLAVELGAVIIDSSLQGMGRSAGNAPTEMLVSALERMGIGTGLDLIEVMDIGEKYIRPLIRKQGRASLDVVTGYAQFHSSYMGTIRKFATQYRVDPRRLIIGVCEKDKVNAPAELVEGVAKKLARKQAEVFTARYAFDEYVGQEQR